MNKPIHRLPELSFKYLQNKLDEAEALELEGLVNQSEANRQLFNELTDQDRINEDLGHLYKMDQDAVWDTVVNANPTLKKGSVVSLFRPTLKYAAAVILIAALGSYWLVRRTPNKPVAKTETKKIPVINDVSPGQYKARLTLADGSVVVLDTITDRKLLQQGSTTVYSKGGELIYEQKGKHNEVLYNTLTTAKGETFGMVLSDGSKVWLNSGSSIRYPVAFAGNQRTVEITGEAYFEVAHLDNGIPFKVTVNGMEVRVLGTHFNINAYTDEAKIRTTLLEGSVAVTPAGSAKPVILKPGQQAAISGKIVELIEHADTEQAVAWKNGYFQFNEADLKTVMHAIERWYDVAIVYEGNVPQPVYSGKLSRNAKASDVLKVLEQNGIHFRIEGKKIIVTP
jgi:transmembrane sensor